MAESKKPREYTEDEVIPADKMLETSTVGAAGEAVEVVVSEAAPVGGTSQGNVERDRTGTGVRLEDPIPRARKAEEKTGRKSGELKTIPGFNVGVREGSAVRMLTLVQPICPFSNKKPDEVEPGEVNCQREEGVSGEHWSKRCLARGHDPYYTVFYRRIPKEKIEIIDGEEVITDTYFVRKAFKQLNTTQVALSIRISSGRQVLYARTRKGMRTLSELGYEEVCQYRNCQKAIKQRTPYGDYCSKRHAKLIAADVEGVVLDLGDTRFHDKAQQKRTRQLSDVRLENDLDLD